MIQEECAMALSNERLISNAKRFMRRWNSRFEDGTARIECLFGVHRVVDPTELGRGGFDKHLAYVAVSTIETSVALGFLDVSLEMNPALEHKDFCGIPNVRERKRLWDHQHPAASEVTQ